MLRAPLHVVLVAALAASCTEPPTDPVDPAGRWRAVLDLEPRRGVRSLLVVYADASRTSVECVAARLDDFLGESIQCAELGSYHWVVDGPFDYVRCDGEECAVLASFDAGTTILGIVTSRRGTRELLVHGVGEDVAVDVFDLAEGRRTGSFEADGWQYRWHNQPLSWIGEDRILAHWGAGTYAAAAILYDASGARLLSLSCDAISASADGPLLACWHPPGAPLATAGSPLRIFDLELDPSALAVELPTELRGDVEIVDVLFDPLGATVLVATDTPDVVRHVVVPAGGP